MLGCWRTVYRQTRIPCFLETLPSIPLQTQTLLAATESLSTMPRTPSPCGNSCHIRLSQTPVDFHLRGSKPISQIEAWPNTTLTTSTHR